MIDVNVSLSRYPFRRLSCDEPEALAARLRGLGVTEAWAGSFDALLHRDLAAVNARTAEACRRHGDGLFRPFGAVDPTLPDWREELRRCQEVHAMPGVRLHPDYHGYDVGSPAFAELLGEAGRRGMVVQVAIRMEDERTLHPLLKDLPRVDPAPLVPLLARPSAPRVVLLNALRTVAADPLRRLLAAGELWADVAMLEGLEGVRRLVGKVGFDRLLLGSHAPFYVPEAAHLQLKESALPAAQAEAIARGNARRILAAR